MNCLWTFRAVARVGRVILNPPPQDVRCAARHVRDNTPYHQGGFTLLELLVASAITALLAGFIVILVSNVAGVWTEPDPTEQRDPFYLQNYPDYVLGVLIFALTVVAYTTYGGFCMLRKCMRARYSPIIPRANNCAPENSAIIDARKGNPGTGVPCEKYRIRT